MSRTRKGGAMNTALQAIPSSSAAWARYCVDNDVSIRHYAAGYELLTGPHATDWLARGFGETLKAIRNSQS